MSEVNENDPTVTVTQLDKRHLLANQDVVSSWESCPGVLGKTHSSGV